MSLSRVERLFDDALTALRKARYNRAHDLFTEAMELEPETPQIHYNLGLAASHLHRWQEARECFRMAIRIQPHPDAWVHLGLADLHLRRWEEARHDFEEALALEANSELARAHLEDLKLFLGREDRPEDAVPLLCAGWFDPRLQDYVGIDPEIVPKARREALREYLEPAVAEEGCDHTHRFSEEWALRNGLDPLGVSRFLYDRGMRCDCEVLAEPLRPVTNRQSR